MSEFKKETIEQASERLYPIILEDDNWDKNKQYRDEFIDGAKWQKEQINCELSELLEQNKEMLAMLELLVQEFDRENATEYEFQVCYKAKKLIKKVKDNEK